MSRRRTAPDAVRRVSITRRDRDVLKLIGLVGMITLEQLIRSEYFPSYSACAKRLRRMFDAGMVRKFMTDTKQPDVYSLTPAGRRIILDVGEYDHIRVLKRAPAFGQVTHGLLITETALFIRSLCARSARSELIAFGTGRGILSADFRDRGLVPDLVAYLRNGRGENLIVAVEVDRESEPLSTLRRKLDLYERIGLTYEVWGVATSPRRLAQMRKIGFSRTLSVNTITARPCRLPSAS